MKIKAVLSILSIAALTACGSSQIDATPLDVSIAPPAPVAQPAVIEVSQPVAAPVAAPAAAPVAPVTPAVAPQTVPAVQTTCDLTTYIPCGHGVVPPSTLPPVCDPKAPDCVVPDGYELCDLWSYNPCAHPTWIATQTRI